MKHGWSQALDDFSAHLSEAPRAYTGSSSAPRAELTQQTYLDHVGRLAESAPAGPWDLTSAQLTTWLDEHNWSKETRRKVLVSLRAFYAWAVSHGRLEWAPTAGVARAAGRRPGPRARTWPDAWQRPVEDFTASLRGAGRSEGTIGQYVHRLRQLADLAADPWAVTGQQLAEWLSNPDWSPQTKRCGQVAAGSFYRWAQRAGHVAVSPAADLPTIRVPRGVPRPAPRDVVEEAMREANDRTRLAIMLALYAGLRCAEVARLHWSQVADTHLVVDGKGGHQRVVPLDSAGDLAIALRVERERRRRGEHGTGWSGPFVTEHGFLFPSDKHAGPITAEWMSKLLSRALGKDWTAHPLRHRFATDAYAGERDLYAVQELLGHARPETTAIYAKVPDGALLAAVQAAGPRLPSSAFSGRRNV